MQGAFSRLVFRPSGGRTFVGYRCLHILAFFLSLIDLTRDGNDLVQTWGFFFLSYVHVWGGCSSHFDATAVMPFLMSKASESLILWVGLSCWGNPLTFGCDAQILLNL